MPRQILTNPQIEEMYQRAKQGESLSSLSKEYGMFLANVSRLLFRRYGFSPDPYWNASITIPDDAAIKAYMAGILDGEGYICCTSNTWMIRIGMTNEEVIDWFASFGGKKYTNKKRADRLQSYTWTLNRRRDAIFFLESVLPYLIVKRDRAQRALDDIRF